MRIGLFVALLIIRLKGQKKIKIQLLNAFKKSFDGYMRLDISKDCSQLNQFPLIDYEDEDWKILGGIYISNLASSILELNQNKISCLLIDTTFRALPIFVTVILMVSIYNVGVPIAFSFSLTENEQIYHFY